MTCHYTMAHSICMPLGRIHNKLVRPSMDPQYRHVIEPPLGIDYPLIQGETASHGDSAFTAITDAMIIL